MPFKYRGITASVYSDPTGCQAYTGQLNVPDQVRFSADCDEGLAPAFRAAVDRYLSGQVELRGKAE